MSFQRAVERREGFPGGARTNSSWRSAREFLAGAITHLGGSDRPAIVTMPAPLTRPAALLELMPERPAILWQTPFGRAIAGAGAALRLETSGASRVAELRERAELDGARLHLFHHPEAPDLPGRFLGGMCFDPASETGAGWNGFPDACFVLPRWSYEREGSRACLRFAFRCGLSARRTGDYLEEFDGLMAGLEAHTEAPRLDAGEGRLTELDIDAWRSYVEASRRAIHEGRFRKVVAARATRVDFERDISPLALLARLAGEHQGSTLFSAAFSDRGGTFLGATPETLISLAGRRLASDPLAGSIEAPDMANNSFERARRGAALLASAKDLAEHALVVESVVRALGPRVHRLDVPSSPRIRSDRHILHLHTPIRGELAGPAHILDFLDALHPTPSVGGVPTEDALAWIREHEPGVRGWYAGPVGWFDSTGDGEFAIAIRSGLVLGRSAHVYAGAGIVADSDPAAEYEETVVKQRPFLRALGASTTVNS